DMLGSPMSFFDVLCLLKALPALVNLRGRIICFGSELEGIPDNELPDHIASAYSGVGSNLQAWLVHRLDRRYISATIEFMLLLALVCPKLWRIQLQRGFLQDVVSKFAHVLNSPPYCKYVSELKWVVNSLCE
ncbi:hypothetical protein IW152_005698, partial [Coemansia sp. BCRC 34962]